MILEITDYFGTPVKLQPRVELYSVRDFMGREMPGLAIVLDEVIPLLHIRSISALQT